MSFLDEVTCIYHCSSRNFENSTEIVNYREGYVRMVLFLKHVLLQVS